MQQKMKHSTVFITIVEQNKPKFSHPDYLCALNARKLLAKVGRPSHQTCLCIIEQILLPNCPVKCRDILNAQAMFGPDLGSLKGKTVQQSTIPVQPYLNDLPSEIMSQYKRSLSLTIYCL
jgi:hypothetical protein